MRGHERNAMRNLVLFLAVAALLAASAPALAQGVCGNCPADEAGDSGERPYSRNPDAEIFFLAGFESAVGDSAHKGSPMGTRFQPGVDFFPGRSYFAVDIRGLVGAYGPWASAQGPALLAYGGGGASLGILGRNGGLLFGGETLALQPYIKGSQVEVLGSLVLRGRYNVSGFLMEFGVKYSPPAMQSAKPPGGLAFDYPWLFLDLGGLILIE